jgi:ribonuclease HI
MKNKNRKTDANDGKADSRQKEARHFHIDGFGTGRQFEPAVTAFVCLNSKDQDVEWMHNDLGITNSEAEFSALIHLLVHLEHGSWVHVFTDSKLLVRHLNGPSSSGFNFDLEYEIGELTRHKKLTIDVNWIPRQKNQAGRLIRRAWSKRS